MNSHPLTPSPALRERGKLFAGDTPATPNGVGPKLYHVSDRPGISRFEPRPSPTPHPEVPEPAVWAVAERLLHNYLLPRDCPRVTFYVGKDTAPEDAERFMLGTSASHVVAIESGWLERVRAARLYLYELPAATFRGVDHGAGYLVSEQAVEPLAVSVIDDVLGALVDRGVELRVMPSLWKLRDAVVASSMAFSNIRWRNAAPRREGE
jgi:hypothetical protein